MPICRARCCTLDVKLSRQDVEEGQLEWEVEQPYILRKTNDNHCVYLGDNGACTTYETRPMECRRFDCRDDARIWQDFDNKIPTPMPFARDYTAK
jgi:Fe-S-cluster containining protein